MRKSILAAALIAASAFGATAHASWFGSEAKPASQPFSLKDNYGQRLHSTTYTSKAFTSNALAFDPTSTTLLGMSLGGSLPSACPTGAVNGPCAVQNNAHATMVGGLPDSVFLIEKSVPGVPTDSKVQGQALVGSDSSGRINAIVVPLVSVDAVARIAVQTFAGRFGAPSASTDTSMVWNLPNGAHATIVYEDDHLVHAGIHNPARRKFLYAAVYTDEGAGAIPALLNTDWSVTTPMH